MRTIRIATRGSKLALVQANMIKDSLEALGAACELVIVSTKGDRNQTGALKEIGGKGLFVREIEEYLLRDEADIAVHSGKDLPYELSQGLVIAGVPAAASAWDCLVTVKGKSLAELEERAKKEGRSLVIGTASPRREEELKRLYPSAEFRLIRGNVDTRLQKLRDGLYDATLLARAGLDRLGVDLSDFDVKELTEDECIPAACQGIIAVECRERDTDIAELLGSISDSKAQLRFMVERNLLSLLEADCSVAMGIHSEIYLSDDNYEEQMELRLKIHGMFEGYHASRDGLAKDYATMCRSLSIELLEGSKMAQEEENGVKDYL